MTTPNLSHPEAPIARKQYTEAEARRILEHAVADQLNEKDFSQEQLQAMANELGLSPDSLAIGEERWRKEEEEATAAFEVNRFRGLVLHLYTFGALGGTLLIVALSMPLLWLLLPLLVWLGFFVRHVWAANQKPGTPSYEKDLAEWRSWQARITPKNKQLPS